KRYSVASLRTKCPNTTSSASLGRSDFGIPPHLDDGQGKHDAAMALPKIGDDFQDCINSPLTDRIIVDNREQQLGAFLLTLQHRAQRDNERQVISRVVVAVTAACTVHQR